MSITNKMSDKHREALLEHYTLQSQYCKRDSSSERANDNIDLVEFVLNHLIENGKKGLVAGDQEKIQDYSFDWGTHTLTFIDAHSNTKTYSLNKNKKVQDAVQKYCFKHRVQTPYLLRSRQKGDQMGPLFSAKPASFSPAGLSAPSSEPKLQSRLKFANQFKTKLESGVAQQKTINIQDTAKQEQVVTLQEHLKDIDMYALEKALLHYPKTKNPDQKTLMEAANKLRDEVQKELEAAKREPLSPEEVSYINDVAGLLFQTNNAYFNYCDEMHVAPKAESINDVLFRIVLEQETAKEENGVCQYKKLKNSALLDGWTQRDANDLLATMGISPMAPKNGPSAEELKNLMTHIQELPIEPSRVYSDDQLETAIKKAHDLHEEKKHTDTTFVFKKGQLEDAFKQADQIHKEHSVAPAATYEVSERALSGLNVVKKKELEPKHQETVQPLSGVKVEKGDLSKMKLIPIQKEEEPSNAGWSFNPLKWF